MGKDMLRGSPGSPAVRGSPADCPKAYAVSHYGCRHTLWLMEVSVAGVQGG